METKIANFHALSYLVAMMGRDERILRPLLHSFNTIREAPFNTAPCSEGLSLTSLPDRSCHNSGVQCILTIAEPVFGTCLLSGTPTYQRHRSYRETYQISLSVALVQAMWCW
jgi:hypothetical protein